MNCLALFLCGPALARYRSEAEAVLTTWEAEYAPAFRELASHADLSIEPGDAAAFRSAAAHISELAKAGVDVDSPGALAGLRQAARELLRAFGVPLPALSPADAAVCELHGAACPLLGGGE